MQNQKYKFIGQDGSMGLVNNKTYELTVRKPSLADKLKGWEVIVTDPVYCPYSSYITFYENWQLIK